MLQLLFQGQVALFVLIMFAIILSLTFHEFGHAAVAKMLGDDTAEQLGRLNLNPMSHIDPMGLLLVVMVGFGYAKPVPFTPRKLKYAWGSAAVASAGPLMNLLIAIVAVNLLAFGVSHEIAWLSGPGSYTFLSYLALINLLLMLFNLIPLGPLDGHYILPWFLPKDLSYRYHQFNDRFGSYVFLALIMLSILGLPIFSSLIRFSTMLLPWITFI